MQEKSDHDRIVEMHSVLMGNNGNPGLCKQVRDNSKNITKLWIAIVVIAMSVGGGTWGVVSAILGA